jgi:hypothetical protein
MAVQKLGHGLTDLRERDRNQSKMPESLEAIIP